MKHTAFSAFSLLFVVVATRSVAAAPDFNRDVRPVLAARCFACHGPDDEARAADLRLDVREAAVAAGAITPEEPELSELVRRIASDDPDVRMPPPDAGEPLSAEQQRTLREWIAGGAKYDKHWAFVPPTRPPAPTIADPTWSTWPRNPIDAFVVDRLLAEGLEPSPEADRYTLVRRVHLDLVGLPPTPEEADAFVEDDDPAAYEWLVDRLLASPAYGERWARPWLDLARYADTNGYEKDRPRSIWPYRDWVVDALNADMPFDRFTIEQLAGDMLPNATVDQRIATGFHRNTMLNEEGGIDPLEFRFHAMVDRVATTGTVWLGLTTGCAQCHTHKYDPISHTEYYRLMALLDNADEPDFAVPDPDTLERVEEIDARIAALEADLPNAFPPDDGEGALEQRRRRHFDAGFAAWTEQQRQTAAAWTILRPSSMRTNLPRLVLQDDGSILSTGDITKRDVFELTIPLDGLPGPLTALRLEALPDPRLPANGPGRAFYEGRKGDFFLSEVTARQSIEAGGDRPLDFATASHSYGKIGVGSGNANAGNVIDGDGSTGWSTSGGEGRAHQLVLEFAQPVETTGELRVELLFERHFAASLGRFRLSATSDASPPKAKTMPVDLEAVLVRDPATWSDDERHRLREHYVRVAPELAEARKPIGRLRKSRPELPSTMVLAERPPENPRPTHRHHRGEYLSPRERVSGGVPAVFAADDAGQPTNRLEFARWLVSERNPLVGRVTVNRDWREFFGAGLVRTSGDFGTQSEPPTHPELLDWLACEFVHEGWSRKRLHRLIVTSATYRQASRLNPGLLERDPSNRLLARGPRFRLDGERIRDGFLVASGLLAERLGGPSVRPPQPASVTAIAYGNPLWMPASGPDRYRRSLYTFQKRTAPFAAYVTFDGPSGESCLARRDRSNTPLQALTLLNDEMFLEFARGLAEVCAKSGDDREIAVEMFRRVLVRPPVEDELAAILDFQETQRRRFEDGELDAKTITDDPLATPEQAAWVMVARAIQNLDEAITKP